MAEAASAGELHMALAQGMDNRRLFLGGPAKTGIAIDTALSGKVAFAVVESATDLARVNAAAVTAGTTVDVLIRVNPTHLESHSDLRMAGIASPFGTDEETLDELMETFGNDGARYAGLHLYAGSQHFQVEDIVGNTRYLCALARKLCKAGYPAPRILDFGGGFGVPGNADQPELDLAGLRSGLDDVYREEVDELVRLGLQRTLFESGRYLVSRAGCYVSRVLDVKRSRGKRFVILDGGINHLGIHQLRYRTSPAPLRVWGRQAPPLGEPAVVVGPTCAPIDITHDACYLPPLQAGDLVVMDNFGAYTINFSPLHFCGHPWPAEVLVSKDNDEVRLVRRRGSLEEACGPGYCDTTT
jgi:diaminopimelate decarboxylase